MRTVQFLRLLFAALALVPAMAHAMELSNKMKLPREEYMTVQQLYRGWELVGIVVFGALVSTAALTIMLRDNPKAFVFSLVAFLCLVGTQIIFWTFTYPVNPETRGWTITPEHWRELRNQWEYSHAGSADLNLIALISLFLSVLITSG